MQRLNLTLSRTQSSGRWDHGERGAAVHRAQIVLHVGADVGVRRAERWFTRPGRRVGRQTDEGNIWDDWTARQSWRSAERKKKYMFSSVKERWKMKWREEDEHHRQKNIDGDGASGDGPLIWLLALCSLIIMSDLHWYVHRQALTSVIPQKCLPSQSTYTLSPPLSHS